MLFLQFQNAMYLVKQPGERPWNGDDAKVSVLGLAALLEAAKNQKPVLDIDPHDAQFQGFPRSASCPEDDLAKCPRRWLGQDRQSFVESLSLAGIEVFPLALGRE